MENNVNDLNCLDEKYFDFGDFVLCNGQYVEVSKNSMRESEMLSILGEVLCIPYNKGAYFGDKLLSVLSNCIKKGHLSVLEHVSITLFIGTNIETYKGLTRHRHASFTVESTKFSKYDKMTYLLSSPFMSKDDVPKDIVDYLSATSRLLKKLDGNPMLQRDFMPQCTFARVAMTANLRELLYIIGLRADPAGGYLTHDLVFKMTIALMLAYPTLFSNKFLVPLDSPTLNTIVKEYSVDKEPLDVVELKKLRDKERDYSYNTFKRCLV